MKSPPGMLSRPQSMVTCLVDCYQNLHLYHSVELQFYVMDMSPVVLVLMHVQCGMVSRISEERHLTNRDSLL